MKVYVTSPMVTVSFADGAALMTECAVETKVISAVSNMLDNTPLGDSMQKHFDRLGAPPWDGVADPAPAAICAMLAAGVAFVADDPLRANARSAPTGAPDGPLLQQ